MNINPFGKSVIEMMVEALQRPDDVYIILTGAGSPDHRVWVNRYEGDKKGAIAKVLEIVPSLQNMLTEERFEKLVHSDEQPTTLILQHEPKEVMRILKNHKGIIK